MDIFEFAMDKEKFSEQYYRDLARRAGHTGLSNILTMLADEEAKHYHTVEQMRSETPDRAAETPVLANARQVFEKMRGAADRFDFHIDEVNLYAKACDIEEESRRFYLEKAEQVANPEHKAIFRRLADEEAKHLFIVENLRSFVARPQTYLDNAEFYHFDDYVGGEF